MAWDPANRRLGGGTPPLGRLGAGLSSCGPAGTLRPEVAVVVLGGVMGEESFAPRQYLGVMVSSTFRYLEAHRAALMRAIEGQGLHAVAMEQDAALPGGTVVDSSLRKVRDAAAYIGVISFRYGQVPDSAEGNPERLSLTELEFREARRLGRPMLIFIMGLDHDVKPVPSSRTRRNSANSRPSGKR